MRVWVADTDTDGDGTADRIDPVIILTKSADPVSVPETGGPVTFTFKVDNTGPVAVELDGLSDTVFGNPKDQGSCGTGGTIETDGSYSCTVTRTLAADDLATHTNKAPPSSPAPRGAGQCHGYGRGGVHRCRPDGHPREDRHWPFIAARVGGDIRLRTCHHQHLSGDSDNSEAHRRPYPVPRMREPDQYRDRGGKTATCCLHGAAVKPGEIANTATVTVVDNDGSTATANASASVTVRPLPTLRLAVAPTSDDGGDATMDDWTLSAMAVQPAGDAFNFATRGSGCSTRSTLASPTPWAAPGRTGTRRVMDL